MTRQIHHVDGAVVISDQFWLPGQYADEVAANAALSLLNTQEMSILNDRANEEKRKITFDDVDGIAKRSLDTIIVGDTIEWAAKLPEYTMDGKAYPYHATKDGEGYVYAVQGDNIGVDMFGTKDWIRRDDLAWVRRVTLQQRKAA